MARSNNKTTESNADVQAFIDGIEHAGRREDARVLLSLFEKVTGLPPRMWGPSIIGFGRYDYRYASGREGDSCRTGFSPRKADMVVYLIGGYENPTTKRRLDALRKRLGKHRVGKSCLYFGRLSSVDLNVLAEMIRVDLDYVNARYPESMPLAVDRLEPIPE
ncbi:MAG: DUF1801 domain-containing protein [Deltaproteobacteria bacterium]|nr:DUF1801 domain-containing protein [Deltaproteobacteria bacterium]